MSRFVIFFAVLLFGCDSSWTIDTAQRSLTAGAEVVQVLDEGVAPILNAEIDRAAAAHQTRATFLAALEPWRPVWLGLQIARAAFTLGQRGLDAWRAGAGASDFIAAGACVLHGLTLVLESPATQTHLLEVPPQVREWITLFGGLAGGVCDQSSLNLETE